VDRGTNRVATGGRVEECPSERGSCVEQCGMCCVSRLSVIGLRYPLVTGYVISFYP
jgi:hypothetical protein